MKKKKKEKKITAYMQQYWMRLVQNSAGNAQSLLEKSSTVVYAISNPFGDRSTPSQSVCEFYFILFYFILFYFILF